MSDVNKGDAGEIQYPGSRQNHQDVQTDVAALGLSRKEIALTMIALMVSLLLAALDSTIVGTAMPRIIGDLNGMKEYSWPFTAYMLASTVAILIFGKLSDIVGRKLILAVGIVIFLAGSALCGASWSMTTLILFRGLQGVGGGVLISSAFIVVGGMFPPRERGKYMGILSSMFGLASVVGPAVGGIITDSLNWRWVFYVNIPLGILALTLVIFAMHRVPPEQERKSVDFYGTILLVTGLTPILLAFNWAGSDYAWNSPVVLGCFAGGVLLLLFFIMREQRAPEPIVNPAVFRSAVFDVSAVASFLGNFAMFAGIIYVPLYLQGVIGISASGSGSVTTPMMLSLIVASLIAGQFISRLGKYKYIGVAGFLIAGVGMALLATLPRGARPGTVLLCSTLLGFGSGLIIPVYNIAVQNAFPRRELGMVTSTLQFFRNIGATIGASVMASILSGTMTAQTKMISAPGVPRQFLSMLTNPRILQNAGALESIKSKAPAFARPMIDNVVTQTRNVLGDSIRTVFLGALAICVLGAAAALLLRELPLAGRAVESMPSATKSSSWTPSAAEEKAEGI